MADHLTNHQRLEFVKRQLANYGGEKRESGTRMMILCPFHSERTPSGSISMNPSFAGYFRCFGCSARAPWNELAPKLNLEPFYRGPPKEEHVQSLLMDMANAEEADDGKDYIEDKLKFYDLPKNKKWRGIPTNFLLKIGARMCKKWYERKDGSGGFWSQEKFIYMPVDLKSEQRGYFLARLKKDTSDRKLPSYLLAPSKRGANWAKNDGLWPFDYVRKMVKRTGINTIVLVEGQRDALRLILAGIPALCIFGTQGWSERKLVHLELAGIERVVVMMDGDCAGIEATEMIAPELKRMFDTKVIKLWKVKGSPWLKFKDEDEPSKAAKAAGVSLWDPGNCPEWILDRLKEKYF